MLKFVVLLMLSCQLVAVEGIAGASCSTESECSAGECCSMRHLIASKRDLQRQDRRVAFPYDKAGLCGRLSAEGEPCGVFSSPCGCSARLNCTFVPFETVTAPTYRRIIAWKPSNGNYVCINADT